ncbi:MAG: hypothetical protein QGH75_15620, partial [Pseudomonadales bacterium]|nr:hypothetical protein [Pseudomonadales bacterium]
MKEIAEPIEAAFDARANFKNSGPTAEARSAVSRAIAMLDSGEERVAQPTSSGWVVNEWLKKAVLLSFLFNENSRGLHHLLAHGAERWTALWCDHLLFQS